MFLQMTGEKPEKGFCRCSLDSDFDRQALAKYQSSASGILSFLLLTS